MLDIGLNINYCDHVTLNFVHACFIHAMIFLLLKMNCCWSE